MWHNNDEQKVWIKLVQFKQIYFPLTKSQIGSKIMQEMWRTLCSVCDKPIRDLLDLLEQTCQTQGPLTTIQLYPNCKTILIT